MIKLFCVIVFIALVFAAEPEAERGDSLFADTLFTEQLTDTLSPSDHSLASGWLIPLTVIGATAGLFIVLFTARSK